MFLTNANNTQKVSNNNHRHMSRWGPSAYKPEGWGLQPLLSHTLGKHYFWAEAISQKMKKNYFYLVNETRKLSHRKDNRVMCCALCTGALKIFGSP